MLSSRETGISTETELKLAARSADLPALRRALAAMANGKKGKRAKLIAVQLSPDVDDVEEYLVGGVRPDQIRWLDEHNAH